MSILARRRTRLAHRHPHRPAGPAPDPSVTPIRDVQWRQRATVSGRVRSMTVQPWGGAPTLECTLVDGTGGLAVVFLGRREVAGIRPGVRLLVRGIVGAHHGRLAMLNPDYEFEVTT